MLGSLLTDSIARRDNFLTRMDSRIKIAATVLLLILNISVSPIFSLTASVFAVVTLLYLRVPARTVFIRLLEPMLMASFIVIIKVSVSGADALPAALLMAARIAGAAGIVILAGMTTPVDSLLKALAWYRVPRTWTDVALLTYRYIFVLLEDAYVVYSAQRARLGYVGMGRSLSSSGTLVGAVMVRAYDQALATSQAMRLRGYNG